VLKETVDFMVILLKFHADFDDIKTLLSHLKPSSAKDIEGTLPWQHDMILNILTRATTNEIGVPRDFFLIPSVRSEFKIPPISHQTFDSTGYSVFISANFHSVITQTTLTLFSLSWNQNKFHLSLVLQFGVLELRTKNVHVEKTQIIILKLEPLHFYSIIFTHQVGMFNLSKESVYLDGERIWKGSLQHPLVDSDLDFQVAKSGNDLPFSAYISSFALFNTPVSPEVIQSLHFSNELSLPISPELYRFQLLPLEQQPILFIHPLGMSEIRSQSCFNISSVASIDRIKLKKIVSVTTRSVLDAMVL
jgi:hypothetical protein